MGSVWRAEHEELRVPVAVKLLLPELVESVQARKRFKREAQAAADLALSTKYVVQVLDHGIDQGGSFIAMDLLAGEDLAERLARVGRLEPEALCSLLSQVGRAIALAHVRGIVHRDLKPANVFLTEDKDTGQQLVKVLDFGIARFESHGLDTSSVETGAFVGTPLYMSPEQLSLGLRVDARSDVWAVGVIAFEALTGKRPLHAVASNFQQLTTAIREGRFPVPSQVADVPSGFDAWFRQAVACDRDERFQSMAAAVNALMHACGVVEDRFLVPGGSKPPVGAVEGPIPSVVGATVQAPGAGEPPEGAPDGSAEEQKDTLHVTGAPSSHSVGPTVEPRRGPRRSVWLVALGASQAPSMGRHLFGSCSRLRHPVQRGGAEVRRPLGDLPSRQSPGCLRLALCSTGRERRHVQR